MEKAIHHNGIPVSPTLSILEEAEPGGKRNFYLKSRILKISALAVAVAAAISFIARFLVYLINLVTNISFFGQFTGRFHSPADNHLGLWVIVIPAIGGLVVGLMALYGSKAIRGHGIPEAMEQILTNESRIKPSITYLKPLSSAIAIGTGGPFGAEGPIIATGGALGSTLGQLFKITAAERKIILAAGATAGMAAIFGTPIAAVFLAIELLLFEFSPKAILPVALACITGAAGHHLLFESGPVFPMPDVETPSNLALAIYSGIGVVVGFLSIGITKLVYFIEDTFEELPIHWMWWPAIGGLAVGVVGYFAPHTLGVGYDNITSILSGKMTLTVVLMLLVMKFISWAIALGSGTSGGTLAPLLTMGGAAGAVIGIFLQAMLPQVGISIPMAALIGMSAMFAGASRAYLTSIAFALEATMQSHALLPLLGACTASYLISFFLMENTIMTEKIARRGVITPDSYEPDILSKLRIGQIVKDDSIVLSADNPIEDVKEWLAANPPKSNHLVVIDGNGMFAGTVKLTDLFTQQNIAPSTPLGQLASIGKSYVRDDDTLKKAVEVMSAQQTEVLPVISPADQKVVGVVSYQDILAGYRFRIDEDSKANAFISLKRQQMKLLVKGKKLISLN